MAHSRFERLTLSHNDHVWAQELLARHRPYSEPRHDCPIPAPFPLEANTALHTSDQTDFACRSRSGARAGLSWTGCPLFQASVEILYADRDTYIFVQNCILPARQLS